jgi:hypothetical protein
MVGRRQSSSGFSLVETMASAVILVIAVLGNSTYRYQSMLLSQRADKWRTGATTAQLLCQSWVGKQGSGTYDPVSTLSSAVTIATDTTGPSVGAGFTKLGNYHLDLNGDRYFATMSWEDVQTGLRALNVTIAWAQSIRGTTTYSNADKSFALTAYYATP